MAKRRKRAEIERDADIGPTPETARKRQDDVILKMLGRGQLTQVHLLVVEEIRDVSAAVARASMKPRRYGEQPGRPGSIALPWLESLSDHHYRLWVARYQPWATALGRDLAWVLAAVVENVEPVGQVLVAFIRAALDDYARRAGFATTRRRR